ncbi:MAG: type 1 glutamine amidotransferase [Actinobacteria bacterium]|nr:type 1 glutamine amidotransferase [Actinomycetota bacterium]
MRLPTVLLIQQDPSDPPGPLGRWLREAGVLTEVIAAHAGATLPTDPTGYAGVVVLGGAASAIDDHPGPWLAEVRELLRAAVAQRTPTLAICLGAQQLAVALNGRVAPNPDGPEIGPALVAKRDAAGTDPLFGPVPLSPDVLQWHYDEVTLLPPGAVLLASSPRHAVQAFRVGDRAWGLQFHIETTPEVVRLWAEEDAAELARHGVDPSRVPAVLAALDEAHLAMADVWGPFVGRFADLIRQEDQLRRGELPSWAR